MKFLCMMFVAVSVHFSAQAAAPDCSRFNLQMSYNSMDPIRDIVAGKVTGSVRMFSDRCESAGQILEIVFSKDPIDPATDKRPAQARVQVSKVTRNITWNALSDSMAKAQGLATGNDLRNLLTQVYARDPQGQPRKDREGRPIDLTTKTWTFIEFTLAR